ncbi:MAG: DUF4124 domain-containing protein [Methylophilaceae bacterium]
MKLRQLVFTATLLLLALPLLANAEVYKWRDKDGKVRYSDTPPPANVKLESVGGKKLATSTGKDPLAPVTETSKLATPAGTANRNAPNKEGASSDAKQDEAAKLRQKNAEIEKKNNEEKEKQAQIKAENCKAAKANNQAYAQGGRVYKVNEKGEREYMSDQDLKAGVEKTQAEINEYCN